MMTYEKIQEIKDMMIVKDKWYHKIPCLGKRIYKKQNYNHYEKNIHDICDILEEEINKQL